MASLHLLQPATIWEPARPGSADFARFAVSISLDKR